MRRFILTLVLVVLAAVGRAAAPVEFDGFGLGNFEGTGSIAEELERIEAARERENFGSMPELAVAMQGAVGRDAPPAPMTAELRSRIARFDVSAGMLADSNMVAEGPARWMGRVGVSNDRGDGRESLELRTMVGNNAEWGLVGVELGPRIERRVGAVGRGGQRMRGPLHLRGCQGSGGRPEWIGR
jgi:hypothetical protein